MLGGQSPAEVGTNSSSSTSESGAMSGPRGLTGSDAGCSLGSLMSHARPRLFSAEIPYQLTSTSYQVRPCIAACGAAWWLLCQPSPKVRIATQKLLVEVSPVRNRREPHICVAEWTSQVACSPTTVRKNTPHSTQDQPPTA